MADLPNGSTIGGERIIHKGIANKHRHHASQIDGLNPLFYGDIGAGGGIDADVLSGKTYHDLTQEFLQVRNDSISSLTLSNHPVSNQHAASLLYLKNSIPNSVRSGNFFGITSIGSPTEESYNYFVGPYNINLSSMKVLINGAKHIVPARFIDIRTITPDYQNTSVHFYIQVSNGSAQFIAQASKVENNNTLIYIGSAYTNGSGTISQYIPIKNEEKLGIGSIMLSKTPKSNAIPVSLETGKVDSGWVFGAKGETVVNLTGQNTVSPRDTMIYRISNYNSFSEYSAVLDANSQSRGVYIASFNEDTLTLYTGDISPSSSTIELIINRDGGDNIFPITLLADGPVGISGPSEVQSGGFNYQFIIEQYIEEYNYTIDVSHGTATRTGNVITYISPSNIDEDIQETLTVSRSGSSDTINFNIIAIPPYELEGRGETWPNDTFTYTINPYDENVMYDITTDDPSITVSESNGIITVQTPPSTTTEYTFTLQCNSSLGNVSRGIIVLGDPEPIDLNFNGVFGVNIFEAIGSPEPALNYTVNVSGIINGVGGYSYGVHNSYGLWTGNFRNGSTLTLNLNNLTIHGKGGRGGVYVATDYGIVSTWVTTDGDPGGDALLLTTPTHLTVNGCTIRAGGGGGGGAGRIKVEVDTSGKGGDKFSIVSSGGGGGGSSWGDTIAERGQTIGNGTKSEAISGQNGSGGSGGYAINTESYEGTVHGTFVHYGGNGGGVGSSGLAATGSGPNGFDREFSYTGDSIKFIGKLGVGGAAGLAIRTNGNMLSYNRTNSIIVGSIT